MAGELKTLSKLTTTQIATLAACEGLAATLWSQRGAGTKTGWIGAEPGERNAFRLIAARLLIEHHNAAPVIDEMETAGQIKTFIPLDD